MDWFSRLFGNDKKIEELENRIKVLEHNVVVMIQVVKNTAGAVEKVGGFMQEIEKEISERREREIKRATSPKDKKEYIN